MGFSLWGRVSVAFENHISWAKFVAKNRNSVAWVRKEIRQGLKPQLSFNHLRPG